MRRRRFGFWTSLLTFAFALALFAVGGNVARADSGAGTFLWFAASIPAVCSQDPSFCPDITKAANGDTIEITGAGTLSLHSKSVTGGGTFTQKNAAGTVIALGVFTATDLLSFSDYGTAVPFFPPNVHGGLAIMRVHLTPSTGGAGVDAILEIDCAINAPGLLTPTGEIREVRKELEGIRLAVHGGPNFNEHVSGFTVFIAI